MSNKNWLKGAAALALGFGAPYRINLVPTFAPKSVTTSIINHIWLQSRSRVIPHSDPLLSALATFPTTLVHVADIAHRAGITCTL